MAKFNTGKKNPMWKGGRTIASNGYVLIRVGKNHHLSDIRGYAYEHRLVAEDKIGRLLKPGEQIHHKDGNKKNNNPENLQIMPSPAWHRVHHRTKDSRLKLPNQENEAISCKCGCGNIFLRYDELGRPREFVSGHNPQESPTIDLILNILDNGPKTIDELANYHPSKNKNAIKICLSRLKKRGLVINKEKGVWTRNE